MAATLVNSFSRSDLCPEELKLRSPKPQVHKGTTAFREHKGSYCVQIRQFECKYLIEDCKSACTKVLLPKLGLLYITSRRT